MYPPLSLSDRTCQLSASLEEVPLIGILKSCSIEAAIAITRTAFDAGLTTVEVALDRTLGPSVLLSLCNAFPERCIGAGSVLTDTHVRSAADAGAAYIVSPIVSDAVASESHQQGLPYILGAATPTEIVRATDIGAYAVKVFPSDLLGGPDFISSLMGPLGSPRLIPIGGISETNARTYIDAGALAVGVGSHLFTKADLAGQRLGETGARTRRLVAALL